ETMVTRERLREISSNNIDLMNHHHPETNRLLLQSRRFPLQQPIGTTLLAPIQEGRFGKGLASLYFLRGWNGEAAEGSYKLLCTEKLSFFVGNVYHFRYNDAALASWLIRHNNQVCVPPLIASPSQVFNEPVGLGFNFASVKFKRG